jgi:hypothetical protein
VNDEMPSPQDYAWYAFWRSTREVLLHLPRDPGKARAAICRAAAEWDQMHALAALVCVLAPLADSPDVTERAASWGREAEHERQ